MSTTSLHRRGFSLIEMLVVQLLQGKYLHEKFPFRKLRELLGHTPAEVFVGAIVGVGTAFALHSTLFLQ